MLVRTTATGYKGHCPEGQGWDALEAYDKVPRARNPPSGTRPRRAAVQRRV